MKKILLYSMIMLLAFQTLACGGNNKKKKKPSDVTTIATSEQTPTTVQETTAPTEEEKISLKETNKTVLNELVINIPEKFGLTNEEMINCYLFSFDKKFSLSFSNLERLNEKMAEMSEEGSVIQINEFKENSEEKDSYSYANDSLELSYEKDSNGEISSSYGVLHYGNLADQDQINKESNKLSSFLIMLIEVAGESTQQEEFAKNIMEKAHLDKTEANMFKVVQISNMMIFYGLSEDKVLFALQIID